MKFTNVRSVYTMNVIVVHSVLGKGVKFDPEREIVQYYTQDGKLLATVDSCEESAQQSFSPDGSQPLFCPDHHISYNAVDGCPQCSRRG